MAVEESPRHTVEILPKGPVITVAEGAPLMPAAIELGYRWPNICGGEGDCGACFVVIEEGIENASPIEPVEALRLKQSGKDGDERTRLACQMKINGPMRVFKRGVRPA
jgi:2Fe-2S ferredoxin